MSFITWKFNEFIFTKNNEHLIKYESTKAAKSTKNANNFSADTRLVTQKLINFSD